MTSTPTNTVSSTPNFDDASPLDNLVWHALATTHAHLALGSGLARRYQPDVAGFVAIASREPAAWDALAELVGPGTDVVLSGRSPFEPPAGWNPLGGGFGFQMVLDELHYLPDIDAVIEPLRASDVDEMLALVELTEPGPFRPRTIELGDYYGIRAGGDLVAMAGERLQTPGFTEVSAVCTHPRVRGRGYASALTRRVAEGILARGQTPILHVAEHNHTAKAVYERLGFAVRTELHFVAVSSPERQPA